MALAVLTGRAGANFGLVVLLLADLFADLVFFGDGWAPARAKPVLGSRAEAFRERRELSLRLVLRADRHT